MNTLSFEYFEISLSLFAAVHKGTAVGMSLESAFPVPRSAVHVTWLWGFIPGTKILFCQFKIKWIS